MAIVSLTHRELTGANPARIHFRPRYLLGHRFAAGMLFAPAGWQNRPADCASSTRKRVQAAVDRAGEISDGGAGLQGTQKACWSIESIRLHNFLDRTVKADTVWARIPWSVSRESAVHEHHRRKPLPCTITPDGDFSLMRCELL